MAVAPLQEIGDAPTVDADVRDVLAVATGSQEALGHLYERHGPLMLALAQRMLRDRREAEDLLHDVFVEVWKRAGDYDPARGSVKTWLLMRVRSRCLDRLKSVQRTRVKPASDALERRSDPAPPGGVRAADGARLRSILSQLPEEQRHVLLLGYFEGMSCTEIADRLGIPVGTVKSRTAAALAKLRERLRTGRKEAAS